MQLGRQGEEKSARMPALSFSRAVSVDPHLLRLRSDCFSIFCIVKLCFLSCSVSALFNFPACHVSPGTRQSMARQVQTAPRVLWLLLFLADVCVTSCLMGACQMANILLASRSFSCSCDEQINFVCSPISRRAPNQFNPAYNPLGPIACHRLLSTSSRLGCAGPGHVSATRSSFAFAFVLAANLSQRWQPTKLSLFGYHF